MATPKPVRDFPDWLAVAAGIGAIIAVVNDLNAQVFTTVSRSIGSSLQRNRPNYSRARSANTLAATVRRDTVA
jgi:hypothetical protein